MAYEFQSTSGTVKFPVNIVSAKSAILHLKTWNPLNLWYGMSPIEAAMLQIDAQTAANRWNLSLLQNQAVPSGVLTVEPSDLNPQGKLTDEQYEKLKADMQERYSGFDNSGRPMILEGGLTWEQMGIAPKDMEFIQAKNLTSREIALIYGVPPMLLNIAGDNTYANYKEAKLAFYVETIRFLMEYLKTEFNRWLVPAYGDRLQLCYDWESVDVIQELLAAKFTSVGKAEFLTQNEKRRAVGYDEVEGMDCFLVGQSFYAEGVDPTEVEEPEDPPVDPNGDNVDPNNPEDEIEDPEGDVEAGAKYGIKLFNLINTSEKQKSARKQNTIKSKHAKDLELDLKDDFKTLEKRIVTTLRQVDKSVFDYALMSVIDGAKPMFEKTLRQNYRKMLNTTGNVVLESGEKHLEGFETKASRKSQVRFSQWVEKYIDERAAKAVTEITGTTKKEARQAIQDLLAKYEADPSTDLAKDIELTFEDIGQTRAKLIARTETNSATNEGTREAVKALEIPNMQKEWVATIDDFTRDDSEKADHVAMNGVRIGIDEKFTVPPDSDMNGPGDPSAGPEQICNCRCALVYGVGK